MMLSLAIIFFLAPTFAFSFDPSLGRNFELLSRSLSLLLLLVLYDVMLRVLDQQPRPMAAMGLGLHRKVVWQVLVGVLLGGGMVMSAVALIAARGSLSVHLVWSASSLRPFLMTLITLVAAAMSEEVIFRGYPF